MELHKALWNIIRTDGEDIVTDLRLVNILDDLNAYQDIQGSKYMMRAIIEDGFAIRFKQIGSLNSTANDLIRKFNTTTGFNADSATKIFYSIAFGLGWINEMPTTVSVQSDSQSIFPPNKAASKLMLTSSKLDQKSEDYLLDYVERAGDYLDSILEYKQDFEKTLGIAIKVNAQFEVYANPSSQISWTIEVNGDIPMKKSDMVKECFEFVIYNHKGRILGTKEVYIYEAIKGFSVIKTEPFDENYFRCVGNIGKIVIYSKLR